MLEVINKRAQLQDKHTQLSEQPVEGISAVQKGIKPTAIAQEPIAEGSLLGKSTAAKPANQKVKYEEVVEGHERETRASGKKKAKVNPSSNASSSKKLKQQSRIRLKMIPKTNMSKSFGRRMKMQGRCVGSY